MKITAFNPMIITKDADALIALFEALGFERRHTKTGINDEDISAVDMKHPDGFRISVVKADKIPQDMTSIRMNVRDLDEALAFFSERGFTNAQGEKITDTGSSRATMVVSPSGFTISVSQHIREEDK